MVKLQGINRIIDPIEPILSYMHTPQVLSYTRNLINHIIYTDHSVYDLINKIPIYLQRISMNLHLWNFIKIKKNLLYQNSININLVPCELELYDTPFEDSTIVQYHFDFPPLEKKIGLNSIDYYDFTFPCIIENVQNSTAVN